MSGATHSEMLQVFDAHLETARLHAEEFREELKKSDAEIEISLKGVVVMRGEHARIFLEQMLVMVEMMEMMGTIVRKEFGH